MNSDQELFQSVYVPLFYPADIEYISEAYEDFIWDSVEEYYEDVELMAQQLVTLGIHVHVTMLSTDTLENWCEEMGAMPGHATSWQAAALTLQAESHHFYGDIEGIIHIDIVKNALSYAKVKFGVTEFALHEAGKKAAEVVTDIESVMEYSAVLDIKTSLPQPDGYPQVEAFTIELRAFRDEDDREVYYAIEGSEELLESVLQLGILTEGQVFLRETIGDNTYVRGWTLGKRVANPLTASQAEEVCCVLPGVGLRVDPEPGTVYLNAVE